MIHELTSVLFFSVTACKQQMAVSQRLRCLALPRWFGWTSPISTDRRMMSVMRVVHCGARSWWRTLFNPWQPVVLTPDFPGFISPQVEPLALAQWESCFCWRCANHMCSSYLSALKVQRHQTEGKITDATSDAFCFQQVSLQIHHSFFSNTVCPGAWPLLWCIVTTLITVTTLHQWHLLENKRLQSTENFIRFGFFLEV